MKFSISTTLFPLFFLFSLSANATVFHAVSDGNWLTKSTWDLFEIPSASDTVVIDGFTVVYNNTVSIDSVSHIEIHNQSNNNGGALKISDESILTVLNDVIITSYNFDTDIELKVHEQGTLNIFGNLHFTRTEENVGPGKLSFLMLDDAQMNIIGDFIYDYKNSSLEEGGVEIKLDNNSILSVAGDTHFNIFNGKEFFIELANAANVILYGDTEMKMTGGKNFLVKTSTNSNFTIHGNTSMINSGLNSSFIFGSFANDGILNINGNLDIISTIQNSPITIDFSGENAKMNVIGNITFDAVSDGDVKIALADNSKLSLGGNIIRPSSFGAIDMDELGSITFNGDTPQLIPATNLPNSGLDSLNLSNLIFNNTSNEAMTLEGPMIVNNSLVLSNGNLNTTNSGILIIEEGGSISGGSLTSFVDGPMMKKGSTNGEPFLFPIGANGVYAPITISELDSSNSEYTAQYFSDPPPFGLGLSEDLTNVSQAGYWEVFKKENSEDADITLHWMNGEVSDLDDINSIVVVGMNDSTFNFWENYGNSEVTGTIDFGSTGTVTSNFMSDPPPFGLQQFAIGTVDMSNSIDNNIINDGKVNLFPNPVNDLIQIESIDLQLKDAIIEIFNRNGQRVFMNTISFESGKYQISTDAANIQNSGVYFLRITNEEGSRILKFTKVN
ncbi:MAG: T9SS type A sorting domain-containing protein [Saprospiraceae bacterium]